MTIKAHPRGGIIYKDQEVVERSNRSPRDLHWYFELFQILPHFPSVPLHWLYPKYFRSTKFASKLREIDDVIITFYRLLLTADEPVFERRHPASITAKIHVTWSRSSRPMTCAAITWSRMMTRSMFARAMTSMPMFTWSRPRITWLEQIRALGAIGAPGSAILSMICSSWCCIRFQLN